VTKRFPITFSDVWSQPTSAPGVRVASVLEHFWRRLALAPHGTGERKTSQAAAPEDFSLVTAGHRLAAAHRGAVLSLAPIETAIAVM
jgi:hypothetical protein